MKLAAALALAQAACYRPAADVACATSCPCPGSLECGPDKLCHAPGAPACTSMADGKLADVPVLPDAPRDGGRCYGTAFNTQLCTTVVQALHYPQDKVAISSPSDCTYIYVPPAGGPNLCVIAATSILIDGTVTLTGTLPIVLFATDSITVMGSGNLVAATVRSQTTPNVGPGADFIGCAVTSGAGKAQNASQGGGGGAGGSFRGNGGAGGGGVVSNGGNPTAEPAPSFVRGGCAGANGGGDAITSASGGIGGHSGGAIYLLAGISISVDGEINASGEGGGAAPDFSAAGGGGAGAGGMIVLDAPSISLTGLLLASGGGGGGGSDPTSSNAGAGGDPSDTNQATRGGNSGAAGFGGRGSSRTLRDGEAGSFGAPNAGSNGTGGGGGGGASGYILAFPTQTFVDMNTAPPVE